MRMVRDADRGDLSGDSSTTSTSACSTPGGFYKGNKARERIWKTESGKAEFTTPEDADGRWASTTRRAASG